MLGRLIDRAEELLMALLLIAMTVVTFVQVVARYGFNSGVVWAQELTVILFAWLVLLGASHLVKTNAHLGVAAFVQIFSTRAQRVFGVLAAIAGVVYAVLLLYGAWRYLGRLYQINVLTEDLGVPKWIPLSALPIGLGLLLLRFLQAAWAIVRGDRMGVISDGEEESRPDADAIGSGGRS